MKSLTKICLFISVLLLLNTPAQQAHGQILDELKHVADTIKYSFKVRPRKFVFNFDNRRTFADGKPVRLNGIRIGIEYNNIVTTFVGFYGLREPIIKKRVVRPYTPQQDTVLDYFDFSYTSFGLDYTFYETKKWQFSVPVQLGLGAGTRDVRAIDTLTVISTQQKGFFPFEMGIFGTYRFTDWLGFGTGLGYRTNLNEFFSLSAFEGVYYSYGIKVFLGVIYRKVFPKKSSSLFYPSPPEWQLSSQ